MKLKFGIQEKAGLLMMAVAVIVGVGTALFLQGIAARTVESHELVDLSDESSLRGWSIIDHTPPCGKRRADWWPTVTCRERSMAATWLPSSRAESKPARSGTITWPSKSLNLPGDPVGPPVFSRIQGLVQLRANRIAQGGRLRNPQHCHALQSGPRPVRGARGGREKRRP